MFEERRPPFIQASDAEGSRGWSRRRFLQAAGFSVAGGLLASCSRAPVEKAIPYLLQPEGVVPGTPLFFASTCAACPAACGTLMKVRDGRPVKLEGNPDHPLSRGGLCAVAQAQTLELYDSLRLNRPHMEGKPIDWEAADGALVGAFSSAKRPALLTSTPSSPTLRRMLAALERRWPNLQVVVYDPLPASAMLQAHERALGMRAIPWPRLERARVIAGFSCDFLGTWLAPVGFTAAWRQGRNPEGGRMAYHIQIESILSLTGTKADRRIVVHPEELGLTLTALVSQLQARAGMTPLALPTLPEHLAPVVEELGGRLWGARGEAVVLCGENDRDLQLLACAANELLGAYDTVWDVARPLLAYQGDEGNAARLLEELEAGEVDAVFVAGVNPVYDLPEGGRWAEALGRCAFSAVLASHMDETAACGKLVLPAAHPLESWGDAEPVHGWVGFQQPALNPLSENRSLVEAVARLAGDGRPGGELVKETFQRELAAYQSAPGDFSAALERGFVELKREPWQRKAFRWEAVTPVLGSRGQGFTLVLYPSVAIGSGASAHNPLLQELPDPVTKLTWDNAALLAPETAARLRVGRGDVTRVQGEKGQADLPVFPVPGLDPQVVAVALGYGRVTTRRFSGFGPRWLQAPATEGKDGLVGVRAVQLSQRRGGLVRFQASGVTLQPTGERVALACTQDHHRLEVPEHLRPSVQGERQVVEEVSLAALAEVPSRPHREPAGLWPEDFPIKGQRWAMVVDLAACTGCSACVVACSVENNVPAVGKDEVYRHREMHWLRIDRYFMGEGENLRVAHQPMLCQHCGHAPCETVCPVLATVHSDEGLNQQVYNRCVGTRYCANNCPYKVRRFNWFDYPLPDPLAAAALNPDVTVRSRGVMEKCTFCVHRIEVARSEALAAGKAFDGRSVRTACQESCPAKAIVFGDLNDEDGPLAQAWASPRRFHVLEELGVKPSVGYLKLVRQEEEHG